MERLDASLVTAAHIKSWTDRDTLLAKVKRYALQGWPEETGESMKPYRKRKDEISVENGCLLWGARVIVPPQLQKEVLDEIHEGHPGMVRMKAFARSYVWWPSLNSDIENKVRSCTMCQQERKLPPAAPIQLWEWLEKPWTRIHIDHAGPFMDKMLLITVDSYSKWIDISVVPSTSTEATLSRLRMLFANHGLPEVVVSDNGSSFTSAEFKEFMSRNGIKHITTAPYHPSSNGQAERAVQTVKAGLRKMKGPLETRVARFLLKYRATPQTTTGLTPAELLMGRKLRTHLNLLYPTKEKQIRQQQERQAQSKGGYKKYCRPFRVGERVLAKNFATGTTCKWLPGVVKSLEGRTMVAVKLEDGRIWRRHIDHIIRSHIVAEDTESDHESDFDPSTMPSIDTDIEQPNDDQQENIREEMQDRNIQDQDNDEDNVQENIPAPVIRETRHSTRTRPPVDRYVPAIK